MRYSKYHLLCVVESHLPHYMKKQPKALPQTRQRFGLNVEA